MPTLSSHTEWLSLVENSGFFLATSVLERVFPQGLDAIDTPSRQRLRAAYEEWREAVDGADVELVALHREWVRMVLVEALGYDAQVLVPEDRLEASISYSPPDFDVSVKPHFAVRLGDETPRLLVTVYPPGTHLERPLPGERWLASPFERMVLLCRASGVQLGLVTDGERWMLVYAPADGISGHVSWYARLWWQEPIALRAFCSLLDARRTFGPSEETLAALLAESAQYQQEVTDTLGDQVRRAVEVLVQALDRADQDRNGELLRDVAPAELYEAGLTVMMRLVFLLCAEERGLLLLGDPVYDTNYAASTLRAELREEEAQAGLEVLEHRHDAWSRLLALFRAVYGGITHESLRMPALGGSLFDPDRFPFLEGRPKGSSWRDTPAAPLPIDNRTILMLLTALQVLEQKGGAQLLSYRALDVEQIGHVYEGLLEYTVARLPEVTLGLIGSQKARNPNAPLPELESARLDGEGELIRFLEEKTGRSVSVLRNALSRPVDDATFGKVLRACGGDVDLARRIRPFAHLLRTDNWGDPAIYRAGAFAVTAGADRRETGTHYTPKSLTEEIVATTLEPLAYVGPAEGKPREEWRLKSAAELLDLKICDPAMGSGAFLVQVCRWLGDRVVEAWVDAEIEGKAVTVDGEVRDSLDGLEPLPTDLEERVLIARRLVAERCIYGVDVNPLAVELAKLSIWLVTLAKGRPFGFLDHNLRHGNSLLGIHDLAQLVELNLDPKGERRLFASNVERAVEEAIELRKQLRETRIRDIRDVEAMGRLDAEARARLEHPKLLADVLVGEALKHGSRANDLEATLRGLADAAGKYFAGSAEIGKALAERARTTLATDLPEGKPSREPFHWVLEFPEVFVRDNGGFDAFVGNPPFQGGQKITGALGTAFRDYLVRWIAGGTRGSADLVAYFFLRAYSLLREGGCFGLLAVNTIAEGDTRQVGLEQMLRNGATIYAAYPNEPWPGKAAVVTSRVHVVKGRWSGSRSLSGRAVQFISAFLSDQEEWSPKPLKANAGKCFQGSIVLGMGFTLSEEEALEYIARDPKNKEVLFPYLNGEDLNSHPEQKPSRWVINFWDWPLDREAEGSWTTATEEQREKWLSEGSVPEDFPGRVAADFPELLAIVESKVKPERQRLDENGDYVLRKPLPQRWWHYGEKRPALYHAIGRGKSFWRHLEHWDSAAEPLERIITISRVTKFIAPAFRPNTEVWSERLIVFASQEMALFGMLASSINEVWVRKNAATFETRLTYTPSDAFETLPFPKQLPTQLSEMASKLEEKRRQYMRRHRLGLTGFYNYFHDPECRDEEILELRRITAAIDAAIVGAYEWDDILLEHGFHSVPYLPEGDRIRYTISEPARLEVLRRLSKLNRIRYREEVEAGLHGPTNKKLPSKRSRTRKNVEAMNEQVELFKPK